MQEGERTRSLLDWKGGDREVPCSMRRASCRRKRVSGPATGSPPQGRRRSCRASTVPGGEPVQCGA